MDCSGAFTEIIAEPDHVLNLFELLSVTWVCTLVRRFTFEWERRNISENGDQKKGRKELRIIGEELIADTSRRDPTQ